MELSVEARRILLDRLKSDLIGPSYGDDEKINDRPSDRYLTGILFPQNIKISEDEDENIEDVESGKSTNVDNNSEDGVSIFRTMRPATAGLSFALESTTDGPPTISVSVSVGTYELVDEAPQEGNSIESVENKQDDQQIRDENVELVSSVEDEQTEKKVRKKKKWCRTQHHFNCDVVLDQPYQEIDLSKIDNQDKSLKGLYLFVRVLNIEEKLTVTAQAINKNINDDLPRNDVEELSFFQFEMNVKIGKGCVFTPRPVRNVANDDDAKTSALIYRKAVEYATGHVCSAFWKKDDKGVVKSVNTSWMPEKIVTSVDPDGDPIFFETYASKGLKMPDADFLASANPEDLEKSLRILTASYSKWLNLQEGIDSEISSQDLKNQVKKHLETCKISLKRMEEGIQLIKDNSLARRAFQTANKAMQIQRAWVQKLPSGECENDNARLTWRPFQLGFALMCLSSLVEPQHDDRSILDLIWFPTGGGKTEAYLLVASFILFYRRLSSETKEDCYGTSVIMRYTLRTLTVQQFQRAAALICACEEIRKSDLNHDSAYGDKRFSIGLWVGDGSTPNRVSDAIKALGTDSESTPRQIRKCPACDVELIWKPVDDESKVVCLCNGDSCLRSEDMGELPVITVDEQIYQEPPSLLIGTIDKFAQIVRKENTGCLFGVGTNNKPPDLIIQDELHLISGPLGTISGIYETAIDHLCSLNGIPPKVIGSTATIRRAQEQVYSLFNRSAFQFPPPVIDHDNSGFAKNDEKSPGRLYVGITTAGRSDKYVLQAVCASLLQGITDDRIKNTDKDPYGTLVVYFNSLRKLGGALVAVQDDVTKSIDAFSRRWSEKPRKISEPEEMTSRKASSEIPTILEQLNLRFGEEGSIDVLLASNMLSVGVDIPRLGLMVVNGQPKTMSEYIQATSRVGRQKVPGLVVTIYNNNKTRDRAHYETFITWHSSLYRCIEATSVTPFAPRARDKALHAALVALSRHLISDLSKPTLTAELKDEIQEQIIPIILKRIEDVDERELKAAEKQLMRLLDEWEERGDLRHYWSDYHFKKSLLISAEKAAARRASGFNETLAWETPNSMRNVEPGVEFQLWESAELNRD